MFEESPKRWKLLVGVILLLCLIDIGGVVSFMLFGGSSDRGISRMPKDARSAFLDHYSSFLPIDKVRDIPQDAFQAIRELTKPDDFKMADPGQPFNSTDMVTDAEAKSLPWRQLQFAAMSKDYLLIHYAKGAGIAFGYNFILLKRTDAQFHVIWSASSNLKYTFDDFVYYLREDPIQDRSANNL